MRRRQAYAVKTPEKVEPTGFVKCPYCNHTYTTRGIYHHKIKCQKMQR